MILDKALKPCPVCGAKAFVLNDVVDGFWFGWSVGCPRYCLGDGIHGLDLDTPDDVREKYHYVGHNYQSKDRAIAAWNERVDCGEWRTSPWN